jgi:hypothetical protein
MLKIEYMIAKIGVESTENEPAESLSFGSWCKNLKERARSRAEGGPAPRRVAKSTHRPKTDRGPAGGEGNCIPAGAARQSSSDSCSSAQQRRGDEG